MNKPYLLALNHIAGIGPNTAKKLLHNWPRLQQLFEASYAELIDSGLSEKLAKAIFAFDMMTIEDDLKWAQHDNHHVLTWEDERYPVLLKEISDPPIALYAAGDLAALEYPAIAMVGTRKPSPSGAQTAWQFAYELSRAGITIVSGLALGIDAKAHQGCIASGGRTIAVMGTGMNRVYPYSHREIAQYIKQNGLILSEFTLNSPPSAGHFPRRNRIISGLSSSTLVVEAAIKSGSLITARLALEQNRDVLAIPGSIHSPQARGCHYLLQQGAKLITTPQDIFEEFGYSPVKLNEPSSGLKLATEAENLVQFVGFDLTTVNDILEQSSLDFENVASSLAELELHGLIKAVPGGYSRCLV